MATSVKTGIVRTGLLALGLGAGAAAVVSIASSGLAAYFARRIVIPELAPEKVEILHVSGLGDDMRVQLSATEETLAPGVYGLFFDAGHGHARIGAIEEYDPVSRTVSRRVLGIDSGDLRSARWGRMSGTVYSHPDVLDLPYAEVQIESDAGVLPTWYLPTNAGEPRDTWAILVHGRGGTRAEGLRAAPVLDQLGIPALAMSYRNDAELRTGTGQRYGLGDTEWRDVDAAIAYALDNGAKRVVLIGWSMGGAIVFQAAARGAHREDIAALILDGPVVDWYDVLDHQAKENFLPTPIARLTLAMITRPWARRITGLDTPVNLDRLDWVKRARELDKEVLLIHSDDDEFVPSGPSHALARVRSDLVTMPSYAGARHTKEYNVDPERWNDDVANFLETRVL
ncbi:lysophospholipase [Brevibacterium sp. 50QC2O2]|jgi:pimeloyl-ACP methyl ester carboxylesterase|uniref:alpha/beta hydrolase n=1 Tax=Brevibacterium TaxID=1696 RepID=UPI00211BF1B2|nr:MULTISPECIES: lysophospholipase [unclassified Brevibacterium]MCQ9366971.1 lysophospholipase [Brevibacterium sp. 91QC2O2]MCQ9384120.1 lysophospholipase [Brevibacterium sp. 68QC2CO]MCQ9388402.1 lysophospholipase [Brevibacterium sp. 50QC2O2]